MDWFRAIGLVLTAVVLLSLLRQYNPVYGILAGVAVCVGLLAMAAAQAAPVIVWLVQLAQEASGADLGCVLRAVGIALVTQLGRDVCRDAGQTALAGQVELGGRVLILATALPLLRHLLELVTGLLS